MQEVCAGKALEHIFCRGTESAAMLSISGSRTGSAVQSMALPMKRYRALDGVILMEVNG
jgi:hypothetical protein